MFTGCVAEYHKFVLSGEVESISQTIDGGQSQLTIKLRENNTTIVVWAGDPISSDYTGKQVVITYTDTMGCNQLVSLELREETVERMYEEIQKENN